MWCCFGNCFNGTSIGTFSTVFTEFFFKTVKDIKEKAFTEVFAKELNQLDGESKEVLDKVVSYLEKKYISVPMKMAREILIDNQQ